MKVRCHVYSALSLLTILLLLPILGCTPAPTTPPSTPTPTVAAPVAPQTTPPPRQLTPQEVEWNKVIDAAKAEGLVTMYTGSDMGGPVRSAIINSMKEKYGINISLLVGRGQDGLQRVKVERQIKKPVGDLVAMGGTSVYDFMEAGLGDPTAPLLPELVTSKDNFYFNPVYDPEGMSVAVSDIIICPMINTNLVKPGEEPQSWLDMLNPKWKGKILIDDPRRGGNAIPTFHALQYYKIVDESYFRKLLELDLGIWGGSGQESINMVARGEYAINFSVNLQMATPALLEGAPLKFLDMKEGLVVNTGSHLVMVKDRPHPNAARVVANWLISAEGQKTINSVRGSKSIRKDVPDFTPEKARLKVSKVLIRNYAVVQTINTYQEMAERLFAKK